jgi:hypothetical protein
MRRRRRRELTATVVYASAYVTDAGGARVSLSWLPAPLETVHAIADEALVKVYAYAWDRVGREVSFAVDVVALVEAEAQDLLDAALDRLWADVRAGRVERGTHADRWGEVATSAEARERLLAAFWRGEFAALESKARANY